MTSNTDLDAFREQMLHDIKARKSRREQKKPVTDAQLAPRPAGAITAAQEVFGIAELRQNILLVQDSFELLSSLADPCTRADVMSWRTLRRKVYLEQAPEIPVSPFPVLRLQPHHVNIWEPNRALLPTDESEFVFRVNGAEDVVFTLSMSEQITYIGPLDDFGNPTVPPNEEMYHHFPVLVLRFGPLHPVPEHCHTLPERVVKAMAPPVTNDTPIVDTVLETMLIDRATRFLVVFDNGFKDIHGRRAAPVFHIHAGPGTRLAQIVEIGLKRSNAAIELKRKQLQPEPELVKLQAMNRE